MTGRIFYTPEAERQFHELDERRAAAAAAVIAHRWQAALKTQPSDEGTT